MNEEDKTTVGLVLSVNRERLSKWKMLTTLWAGWGGLNLAMEVGNSIHWATEPKDKGAALAVSIALNTACALTSVWCWMYAARYVRKLSAIVNSLECCHEALSREGGDTAAEHHLDQALAAMEEASK